VVCRIRHETAQFREPAAPSHQGQPLGQRQIGDVLRLRREHHVRQHRDSLSFLRLHLLDGFIQIARLANLADHQR
jgi:hypothetical protein